MGFNMDRSTFRSSINAFAAAMCTLFGVVSDSVAQVSYTKGFVTGAGNTGAPHVVTYVSSTGAVKNSFFAFSSAFRGGASVGSGDVNNDGVLDVIAGAGPGGGPHVIAFDGVALAAGQQVPLYSFFAFEQVFSGGVYVAGGDVNNDGYDDMIAAAGPGGGPRVQVFSGRTGTVLMNFFAYAEAFRGGVTVGSADVNNDGFDDIITGAGPGGGPHVKVFSGANGQELYSFFAFPQQFTGGVFVAGGDVSGDGIEDIIVSAGPGSSPRVRIYSGANLGILKDFIAFDAAYTGGVRVGALRKQWGGTSQLIVGGQGGQAIAKVLNVAGGFNDAIQEIESVQPYPGFNGSVNVAGFAYTSVVNTPTPTATATHTPNTPPPPSSLTLTFDGIYFNGNGTYTAYFGYINNTSANITIPIGSTATTKNFFSPAPVDRGQGTVFKPGVNKGVIAVIFDGNPLTFTVQPAGGSESSVTASCSSASNCSTPQLAAVEPLAECVIANTDGSFAASMGYQNINPFPIIIPVGDINKFEPGLPNRGQPSVFKTGLNSAAFTVLNFSSALTWRLATKSVVLETTATKCVCPTVAGINIKDQLNEDALALNRLADKAAALIRSVNTTAAKKSAKDVATRAKSNLEAIRAATLKIPNVIVSCPETPPSCVRIDNQQSILSLQQQFDVALHIVKRGTARANFLKTGKTKPANGQTDPLVTSAEELYASGLATLSTYPRFSTSCPNR